MSVEATTVWTKIMATLGGGKSNHPHAFTAVGSIPVYDEGVWRFFRNPLTIYPGAENCADPVKVDALRENARNLLAHYPETIAQLEKYGARVKALLNRPITDYEGVVAWAQSIFNMAPASKMLPQVHDTIDLAYDDVVIQVKGGRNPVYVIPAAPRGEGVLATLDISVPGSKVRYGPRHEYTKLAFAKQVPDFVVKRYRGTTAPGEPQRPRGRPRKDGLVPGSPEAKEADRKKEEERLAKRAARAEEGWTTSPQNRIPESLAETPIGAAPSGSR